MTTLDYLVLGFYFFFMLVLGPVYKSFSKTASDYFRGGGGMLWWMVGVSGFMTAFSAWSFTGGAAKAYETGSFFLLLYGSNFVGLIFTYFFTAARFRQMRVITGVEAIRNRFDKINEQFHTWIPVPFFVIFGGIGLYTIAIFMSVVFSVDLVLVIVVLGVIVTVMSILGGSWAIVASDFLQMLTVCVITVLMSVLVLRVPEVGGLSGLLRQLPKSHYDWTEFNRPWILVVFGITLLMNQLVQMNHILAGASKYVYCKNGPEAKKATLLQMGGFLLLSPVWMIPALAATILHPDLAAQYPTLNNPNEAAYVATALTVLPQGLMGLLVAGMFAATMSSMDSGLNRSAGILVRNFYLTVINPAASEERQIVLGRWITALFGLLMILMGIYFSTLRSMPLFNLILLASAMVGIPTAVPLFFGMFIRKAPAWAGWSTPLVGFASAIALRFILKPDQLQSWFGRSTPLNANEIGDLTIAITTVVLFIVCILWFLMSTRFANRRSEAEIAHTDAFFLQMNTPVDIRTEHAPSYENDRRQYLVLAKTCMAYGLFISALALLPNTATGRLGLLFCGGVILGIGCILLVLGKRLKPESDFASAEPPTEKEIP